MQQLQQIYAELTGKSESISSYYDDPIRLSLDDVELLHHKIVQTWEQYHVTSSSCSFTVYHQKETKNEFNSFDRFKLQIGGGGDAVESLFIKYDFLVIPPNVFKAQTYSISIRLVSRLAVERRLRRGGFFSVPSFIRKMAHHTGSVEVTYVDYSIARALRTTVDEWFQTIPRSRENKSMK
ncbi:MAG TPA: hypothetical protein VMQ99_00955 [Acetobacteraceae bacterium]|nr:hypothetical protein [Acetobacteraceae bacterium]